MIRFRRTRRAAKTPAPAKLLGETQNSQGRAGTKKLPQKKKENPEIEIEDPDEDDEEPENLELFGEDEHAGITYAEARRRREIEKLRKEELENSQRRGELVSRDTASKLVQELAAAARSSWTQWTAQVYAELAAELGVDATKLHQILDRFVRQRLQEVSDAPLKFKE